MSSSFSFSFPWIITPSITLSKYIYIHWFWIYFQKITYYFITVALVYDKTLFDNNTNEPTGGIRSHLRKMANGRHAKDNKETVDFLLNLSKRPENFFDAREFVEFADQVPKNMHIIFYREVLQRRPAKKLARRLAFLFRREKNIKYLVQSSGFYNLADSCTYQTTTNLQQMQSTKKIIDMYYQIKDEEAYF